MAALVERNLTRPGVQMRFVGQRLAFVIENRFRFHLHAAESQSLLTK
jgi:hypothetical protein